MSSLKHFDPQSLDRTIYVQDVRGLGRGRGFKVVGKRPVSNTSPAVQSIKLRLLDLALMLYEDDLLSGEEVANKLGLPQEDQSALREECAAVQADLEETEEQLEEVKDELKEARREIEDYSLMFGRMVRLIADALEEDPDMDWEVDEDEEEEDLDEEEEISVAALKFGVERLIADYLALKASEEED